MALHLHLWFEAVARDLGLGPILGRKIVPADFQPYGGSPGLVESRGHIYCLAARTAAPSDRKSGPENSGGSFTKGNFFRRGTKVLTATRVARQGATKGVDHEATAPVGGRAVVSGRQRRAKIN
ncbi:hypothetical protein N7510_004545 [Penicillium lagena]|uniref:uncharacterized protein n=1 Tax=Penicillium lagena TaxID=94218 RepID=UPI0025416E72|nr:uncharacterized protein N7510_004545 [Penicillium lagena]KAJ5620561.1 hypothetical protein N7510_004545 [Penicillium lagena]